MWASFRAELLILRRSPAGWVLVAVTPAFLLLTVYGFGFAEYGLPGQLQSLDALLPAQSVIQATNLFAFYGLAPFVVLGALMAGNDWQSGTIAVAIVQGPGRLATFLGQVLAMIAACLLSVLATFAVSAIASLAVLAVVGQRADSSDAAVPSLAVIGRGIGVAVLISVVYGALGIALGTVLRSAYVAIAAALVWVVIIEGAIYELGLDAGGWMRSIADALPQASAITLDGTFGAAGGGPNTAMYLPVEPAAAVIVLGVYLIGFLAVSYGILAARDVGLASARRRMLARRHPIQTQETASSSSGERPPRLVPHGRRSGVLASYMAELAVFVRWPTIWALALLPAVTTLIGSYLTQYVLLINAARHSVVEASAAAVLPSMLPGQFVAASLNGLNLSATLNGTAAFFLLGAFVSGRAWSDRTLATALLQGPGRTATALGQSLAVVSVLVGSVVLMFSAAAAASELVGSVALSDGLPVSLALPQFGVTASGFAAAVLVALAWGAAGTLLGALFRNATGPAAVLLLWSVFLQIPLGQLAADLTGVPRVLYDLLPDSSTNTLAGLFGSANSTFTPVLAIMAPATAIIVLVCYALAGFGLPVVLTRLRNIT